MLDPFNGSGTTGYVSVKNGRDYIGIDLSPAYNEIAERRLSAAAAQPALDLCADAPQPTARQEALW